MNKWFLGALILLIVTSIYAFIAGPKNSELMGNDIQKALNSAGYGDWATVDMHGHVATIKGEAPNLDTVREAVKVAQGLECSKCTGNGVWHKVLNKTSVKQVMAPPAPVQSPYTFSVTKNEDGTILLNGYVSNREAGDALVEKARATFDGTISDNSIRIANGAPDGNWLNVIQGGMDQLASLDKGRFQIEDSGFLISGDTSDPAIRAALNDFARNATSPYSGAANINVTDMAAEAVGQVRSQSICQALFDDLRQGKKINFTSSRSEIRGSESFDLLGQIASAANQCDSLRIRIEGHTDSQGDPEANQRLSEERANSVLASLAEQGVERERMISIGFGETRPIADNDTVEGRRKNRRTAFVITQAQ